jgi:hypothetical protein
MRVHRRPANAKVEGASLFLSLKLDELSSVYFLFSFFRNSFIFFFLSFVIVFLLFTDLNDFYYIFSSNKYSNLEEKSFFFFPQDRFNFSRSGSEEINIHGVSFIPTAIFTTKFRLLGPHTFFKADNNINVTLPLNYFVAVCENSVLSVCSVPASISCNAKDVPPSTVFISREILFALDVTFPGSFQHNYINGLPSGTLLLDQFFENQYRAFLCYGEVCNFLENVVGESSIIDLYSVPCIFSAPTSYFAFVEWEPRQPFTWDSYPIGSFSLANFKVSHANPTNIILYLSRGTSGSRFIFNEKEFIDELQSDLEIENRLQVFEFQNMLSLEEQRDLFYSASIVIGMHGGAFSNVLFCNKRAVVIEINQRFGRDCFAVMSIAQGLKYERFVPIGWPGYDGGGFFLQIEDIRSLVDLVRSYL